MTGLTVLTGLIFSLETALYRALGYFYPIETVTGMGGAVLGSYSGTILQTFISVLPFILIYQLPTIAYLFISRWHNTGKQRLKTACLLTAFSVIVNAAATYSLRFFPEHDYIYNEGYEFNEAVKLLGLSAALKQNTAQYFKNEITGILTPEDRIPSQNIAENSVSFNTDSRVRALLEQTELPKEIAELNRFVSGRVPSLKNEKSAIFKGKNLIFICAEALSPYAVSKELTPTLFKLCEEGISFTNYYAPTFGESTSGGEYALLLSQIPKRTSGEKGLSMQLMAKNELSYSLPSFFRSNGYACNGYHNNSYTYYSRNITHPALGLNWYGCGGCVTVDGDAEKIDLAPFLTGGWPRSDKELIEATATKFINRSTESGIPFFTYYLTVSGHNNYSFKGNSISSKNRGYTEKLNCSDTVKAYLAAQKELDTALETLLNTLADANILENTVIVIANDHHPYGLSPTWAGNNGEDYLSELYGKKAVGKTEIEKGFFTVYCHGLTSEQIDVPTSSFDVLPTLLNLFGIEYDSRIFCGKDAFSDGERLVFFSDGSFITDRFKYDKALGSQNEEREYVERTTHKIRMLTRYSLSVRKNDYYSYLSK